MTTQNVQTKISKVFTLSIYKGGTHIVEGWGDEIGGNYPDYSFKESLSPMHLMIKSFQYRPLGTKIKVTMEEVT